MQYESTNQPITTDECIKGGRPVLNGTKLSVVQILELIEDHELTPCDIVDRYENVDGVSEIQAVLQWAEQNPAQVSHLKRQRDEAKRTFLQDAEVY